MRLDQALVAKGLVPSREFAAEEIRKGLVLVNHRPVVKPGYKLKAGDDLTYEGQGRPFVSRGALKIAGAYEAFGLDFTGKRCLDVGASTGGFTEFMLKAGAEFVIALDVGRDQLAQSLKEDPRVLDLAGVNFRAPDQDILDRIASVDFVTADVSFISLTYLKDSLDQVLKAGGEALFLIKPQFEAGPGKMNKNGVVKHIHDHIEVLQKVIDYYQNDYRLVNLRPSPIQGPEGNVEYLAYFIKGKPKAAVDEVIRQVAETAFRHFKV